MLNSSVYRFMEKMQDIRTSCFLPKKESAFPPNLGVNSSPPTLAVGFFFEFHRFSSLSGLPKDLHPCHVVSSYIWIKTNRAQTGWQTMTQAPIRIDVPCVICTPRISASAACFYSFNMEMFLRSKSLTSISGSSMPPLKMGLTNGVLIFLLFIWPIQGRT